MSEPRFHVTVRWRPLNTGAVETFCVMVEEVRGDAFKLVLHSRSGLEVHFPLSAIESVYMERKG
jgi:hypothetical protein